MFIRTLSVAGHPEGHLISGGPRPSAGFRGMAVLGHGTKIHFDVVTQFCFESAPILNYRRLDARGVGLPVMRGLADAASPAR